MVILTDMSVSNLVQEFPELRGIDEVAVVSEADAVGAVHVEGLCLGARTCRRAASACHMVSPIRCIAWVKTYSCLL